MNPVTTEGTANVYFTDRLTLGQTLANGLTDLRGKDAVILCLKESALLMCIGLAQRLHAWIYPLLYVPINTGQGGSIKAAFNEDGEICIDPAVTDAEQRQLLPPNSELQAQKQAALASMQLTTARYGMKFDKHKLDGRDVILAGDIITDPLPVVVARRLLDTVQPKSIGAVAGNATPDVAELLRLHATRITILDVLSGAVLEDDRYFEQSDSYTPEQQVALADHIATYWQ